MRRLREIFIGPKGIRAGWRLGIFLAIVTAGRLLVGVLAHAMGYREPTGWVMDAAVLLPMEAVAFVIIVFAVGVMARIERRKFVDYGWPWRRMLGREFWEGSVWGLAANASLIGLIALAGGYSAGGLALSGRQLLAHALLWAVAFLLVGLAEELFFRGYVLVTLADGISFWPAAWFLAAAFGALHYFTKPYETWVDGVSTGLFGLLLAMTLWRTGRLAFAVGFHWLFNFSSMFIFGSPNGGAEPVGHLLRSSFHGSRWITGGPLGAEASVFIFVVLAALFAGIHLRFRQPRWPART